MPYIRRVVVGQDGQKGTEAVLLHVVEIADGEKKISSARIRDTYSRPSIAARKKRPRILVTESSPDGMRVYVLLERSSNRVWHFTMGIVVSMARGWLQQGSASMVGRIVFDSSGALDRLLAQTTQRNDLYRQKDIYPKV